MDQKKLTKFAIEDLVKEVKYAREKFHDPVDLLAALMEEVGELSQSLLRQKHEPLQKIYDLDIRKEAIRVASVAIRIATEGDEQFPGFYPASSLAFCLECNARIDDEYEKCKKCGSQDLPF